MKFYVAKYAPGGLRAKTLVEYAHALYGLELTEERAEEIIAAWENRWREARMYLRWVEDQLAQSKDFYRLPNGRGTPMQQTVRRRDQPTQSFPATGTGSLRDQGSGNRAS